MGSLQELSAGSQLHNACLVLFIFERLCHDSWRAALDIIFADDNQVVTGLVQSIMARRVTAAATDELATGGVFWFPLPSFISENHQDVQFLTSVCQGQVSLFVMKCIIVSWQHVYYSCVLTL
jgi:hypothetical protein